MCKALTKCATVAQLNFKKEKKKIHRLLQH